ncbi:hypothetical protein QBZ16_000806 [Prototheca wickerhamii]|uniref:Uncharacterized protein n=1 Tax=Prototheca wickerhamii TaxID=3111 RepID=A0AAD9IQ60_PROWI|nr:hypothetical protein QBZ16_000806 [Prototheca wickerhamii]
MCSCVSTAAAASLMAVDLGTEFMKVALVQSGRTPISIVINEISKRKTTAMVGFVGADRVVGEEAAGLASRSPDSFVTGVADLLGRDASDPRIESLVREGHLRVPVLPPADQGPANRTSASPLLDFGEAAGALTAEEAAASLLEYAAAISHEASGDGSRPRDVVIVASSALGPRQRRALADAAAVADLNLLGLVSPGAAAALQYGVDRVAAVARDGPQLVLFFDMGSGSTELTLARFSAYERRGAPAGQVEEALGAAPGDLARRPKAFAKLRDAVKRALRVLSANGEARLSLLARNNVTAGQLAAVELLGGGSRIPRVKAELSAALGDRALDVHLDADEAVVLGAGLFAANRSTLFRLRPFGLVDRAPYAVDYELVDVADAARKRVVPAGKRLPIKRAINLIKALFNGEAPHVAAEEGAGLVPGADTLAVELFEGERARVADEAAADARDSSVPLGRWRLENLTAALGAERNVSRVALHVRVDESGLLEVDGADMTVTRLVTTTTKKALDEAQNATVASNGTDSTDAASAATLSANETTTTPRTTRVRLPISGGWTTPGLSREQLRASRGVMTALASREATKRAAAQAKNDLEGYILSAQSWLAADEDVLATSTEAEREAFAAALEAAEDWLYGEGEAADRAAYDARMEALLGVGTRLRQRANERVERPKVLAEARQRLADVRPVVAGWAETKPWLPAKEVRGAKRGADELEAWLDEVEARQAKKSDLEEPAFTVAQAYQKLSQVLERRTPPPAPKPPAGEAKAPEAPPTTQKEEPATTPDKSEL